ncbi:FUSC family protein [Terriglobus aquaticus]|uniref:FUSC family protein n=1 Tax=Terriglobus aquaticus TaxID=940139 RepID=A0ABW9KLP3_9BACT|nr:FUSC family protein [Terriglobus aquaticus]
MPRPTLASLWDYLKQELKPYPGRWWLVLRMVMAAAIMMLWVVTFRIPNAALGVYYTLLISRESASETWEGAWKLLASIGASLVFTLTGNILTAGSPVLHFLWVGLSFLVIFFLISAVREYRVATGFGFLAISSIPLWDFPTSTDRALTYTLWAALSVTMGAAVTVVVETVFAALHRTTPLEDGVLGRLSDVASVLHDPQHVARDTREQVLQYSEIGTGLLRRYLARADAGAAEYARQAVLIGLAGRLIDLTAALLIPAELETLTSADLEHLRILGDRVQAIREIGILQQGSTTPLVEQLPSPPTAATVVQLLHSTVDLLGQSLDQPQNADIYIASDELREAPVFKRDAFTNPQHLVFALRGGGAAMSCFLLYHLFAWPGLSSSLATCMITALSTTGSSRQKQILRVLGAITGGLVLGIGAQVFLTPAFDTVASFGAMFTAVTAIAAWIATSSPRISFYGVQIAFAFYLVHLRVFGPQRMLTPARDNVIGILLGLLAMWLIFDQWDAQQASTAMRTSFVHAMRQIVTLMRTRTAGNGSKADLLRSIRAQRDSINATFTQVRTLADSVLLEFSSDRSEALRVRRHIRTWTPELRAFFLLQVTLSHIRLISPDGRLLRHAEEVEEANAATLESLADYLEHGSAPPISSSLLRVPADGDSREYTIVCNSAKILKNLTPQFLALNGDGRPGDDPAEERLEGGA